MLMLVLTLPAGCQAHHVTTVVSYLVYWTEADWGLEKVYHAAIIDDAEHIIQIALAHLLSSAHRVCGNGERNQLATSPSSRAEGTGL